MYCMKTFLLHFTLCFTYLQYSAVMIHLFSLLKFLFHSLFIKYCICSLWQTEVTLPQLGLDGVETEDAGWLITDHSAPWDHEADRLVIVIGYCMSAIHFGIDDPLHTE